MEKVYILIDKSMDYQETIFTAKKKKTVQLFYPTSFVVHLMLL